MKESRKAFQDDGFVVLDRYLPDNESSSTITFEAHRDVYLALIRDLTRKYVDSRIGIFTANDHIGVSVLLAAMELDVSVPDSIGIVGFDDSDAGANAPLPLTTIKQNFFEIGKRSAETVVGMIKSGQPLQNPIIDVDVDLIVRSTT
jgi:DNA-binding LacI/PurR family transcriptional regulator